MCVCVWEVDDERERGACCVCFGGGGHRRTGTAGYCDHKIFFFYIWEGYPSHILPWAASTRVQGRRGLATCSSSLLPGTSKTSPMQTVLLLSPGGVNQTKPKSRDVNQAQHWIANVPNQHAAHMGT